MPKPPPKLKKPASRACGDIRYRVIRGPKEDRWYWRAERYSAGRTETVWTGWATVIEADHAVSAIASGSAPKGAGADTVRDLLGFWLGGQEDRSDITARTLTTRTYQCRGVLSELADVRLERLDRMALEGLRDRRLRKGAAPRTVFGELGVLHQAWRWGREIGLCPDRELPSVRLKLEVRRKTPAPTPGSVRSVAEQLSGWPRIAVLLLEGTGCRLGEIADLTWAQVDLDAEEIRVQGKTGSRPVPLSSSIARELAAWRPEDPRPEARVLGVSGETARSRIRLALKEACKEAGIPDFCPQGLRRAAVGALYRSGADVGTAAALIGHSPQTALKYYREVSEEDRRGALLRSGLGRLAEEQGEVISLDARRKRG